MALVKFYQGEVTAGKTDGTIISTNGSMSAPVDVVLDPLIGETKIIPLAIRTEAGYKTTGTTTISDVNDTNDRWQLFWTPGGNFTDSIETDEAITSVNTLFYAKVCASSNEALMEDTTVSLHYKTKIVTSGDGD